MTVLAIGSLAGAPGATTLAVELARRATGRVLLIEADSDGGRLAARFDLAVRPGLADLAASCRMGLDDPDELWHFAQAAGELPVVVAHPAADAVSAALRAAAVPLAAALRAASDTGTSVVIDVGRLRPGSAAAPLAAAAHHRLVVTHPTLEAVALLTHRGELLGAWGERTVVCAGRRPYGPAEVARATGEQVVALPRPGGGRLARRRRAAFLDRFAAQLFALPAPLPAADEVAS